MKKMRRLIPAMAMLLVSAVMLSTASFAWFTMNDAVTATGMQVQAKASGNLIIGKKALSAADQNISVDFADVAKKNLTPVTWNDTAEAWQVPGSGVEIDPLTGTYDEDTVTWITAPNTTFGSSAYHADYTVYLATAGDAMNSGAVVDGQHYYYDLYANVEPISGIDQAIAPAYSIAFLVNGTQVAEMSYLDFLNLDATANGKILVAEGVNVPSTYGTTADTAVGLKVEMRIYVDGDLDAPQKAIKEHTIKTITSTFVYSTATHGSYVFYDAAGNVVDNSTWVNGDAKANACATYWDGTYTDVMKDAKYVNNGSVPTGATNFSVTLSVTEVISATARG